MTGAGTRLDMRHHPVALETVSVDIPEAALEAYEAAFSATCATVGFFRDAKSGNWRVEGVKPVGNGEGELTAALALAAVVTGVTAPLRRTATPAEGWLARTRAAFPEQRIGRRFVDPWHASERRITGGSDYLDTGCERGVWVRRAWVDPRLPACSGTGCAAPTTADPGSRHGVGHPRDGGCQAAASARPRHRYRAMVDPRRAAERFAQSAEGIDVVQAGGWLAAPQRARRLAL